MDELKYLWSSSRPSEPSLAVKSSTHKEIADAYGNGPDLIDDTLLCQTEWVDLEMPDISKLSQDKKESGKFFAKLTDQIRGWSLPAERTQHSLRDALTVEIDPRDVVTTDMITLAGVSIEKKIADEAGKPRKKRETDYVSVICKSYKDDGQTVEADNGKPIHERIRTESLRKIWEAKKSAATLGPSGLPIYMDAIMKGTAKSRDEESLNYCALAGLKYKISKEKLEERIEALKRQCHKIMHELDELVDNYNQLGYDS